MPGSKSAYLSNRMLDSVLGGPPYATPTYVYIALSSEVYNDAATGGNFSELLGANYARVAVNNDSASWPAAANQQKTNGGTFTFAAATADWLEVRSFYILDALAVGAGNILYGGDLITARIIEAGDTASFGPGSIVITED